MAPARLTQLWIVWAVVAMFVVGRAAADEPRPPPALIGLTPVAEAPPPPPARRKLWIALGVVSAAAVVGTIVAVGVTLGTSSGHASIYNDWGTLQVNRR
jgi:hypothetical protein